MRQAIGHIFVETRGKGLTEITGTLARWVAGQGIATAFQVGKFRCASLRSLNL